MQFLNAVGNEIVIAYCDGENCTKQIIHSDDYLEVDDENFDDYCEKNNITWGTRIDCHCKQKTSFSDCPHKNDFYCEQCCEELTNQDNQDFEEYLADRNERNEERELEERAELNDF